MKNDLVGVQPLVDVCALVLQSNFIENEANGVNVLMISNPEAGKTTTIEKFSNLDFVAYYDEITAKKLLDEFLPMVKQGQYKCLLIPDLINCIEKQKSTRQQFLALMKTGTDDTGVKQISTYNKSLQYKDLAEGLKFTVITAITNSSFKGVFKEMRNTGLLSRFIPFSFSYNISKIRLILDIIEGKKILSDVKIPKIIKKPIRVEDNPELFQRLEIVARKLGEQYDGFGIRAQRNLQRLCKANAILNGRKSVTEDDIKKVLELSNWINFDYNTM